MKHIVKSLTISTWLLSSTVIAAPNSEQIKTVLEAQESCRNFVRYDDQNIYLGFGTYQQTFEEPRFPIPAKMAIAPLDGSAPFALYTNDAAIDYASYKGSSFILTHSSIEEWDLKTKTRVAEYATIPYTGIMSYKQHAESMGIYQNKLVIAHGRLGISFFNLDTKQVTNHFPLVSSQDPLESMATGITVLGKYAYVVMDNFSMVPAGEKPPFRGVIVVDLEKEAVVNELEGMDPGVDSVVADSKSLIVSYMGQPVWKYDMSQIKGSKMPKPKNRVWNWISKGHPTGAAIIDDQYYYTCFHAYLEDDQQKLIPKALNRKVLMLE
jgi:hypothetical protein